MEAYIDVKNDSSINKLININMSVVIDDLVKKAENLISGMQNNLGTMKKLGFGEKFIRELEAENNALKAENQEIERLQKEARARSIEANKKFVEFRMTFREVKKKIKAHYAPEKWKDVGILDKK
jgi:hypothetical protein